METFWILLFKVCLQASESNSQYLKKFQEAPLGEPYKIW